MRVYFENPDHRLVVAQLAIERIAGRSRRRGGPGQRRLVERSEVQSLAAAEPSGVGAAQREADDGGLNERGDGVGRKLLGMKGVALRFGEAACLQRRLSGRDD